MKRGISLIAVLMFMLAATTASVVLFRWIGEENFASGARLKSSEAYQASEAGLEAVSSWLSFKAADVGALVSDYLSAPSSSRSPRLLNSVLGGQQSGERFDVYLLGADTVSKPFKLKFLSIGKGRDNSEVKQTAIFKVDGLYSMKIQRNMKKAGELDYNEDFWGNLGMAGSLEMMRAVITQNPNIMYGESQGLNSVKIGTETKPGYLVLDGNYYTNHGIQIYGDLYSTGDFDLCSATGDNISGNVYIGGEFHPRISSPNTFKIGGSAYFAGKVTPNVAPKVGCTGGLGGTVQINGNATIRSAYEYYTGHYQILQTQYDPNLQENVNVLVNVSSSDNLDFNINGSLVMDSVSYMDLGNNNISYSKFEARQNVAIKNFNASSTLNNLNYYPNKFDASTNAREFVLWPKLGMETGSELCLPAAEKDNAYSCDGCSLFYYNSSPKFYFKTNTGKTQYMPSCNPSETQIKNWGADPLDGNGKSGTNLKSKLSENPDIESCENTPIKFDQTLYEEVKKDNAANWVHRRDKPGSCARGDKNWMGSNADNEMLLAIPNVSGAGEDLGKELQDCWNAIQNAGKQSSELYDGEWLVVYIKDKANFSNSNNNSNLNIGNYIVIYEAPNSLPDSKTNFWLPPTSAQAQVMLYLPNGYKGTIELSGEQLGDGYRYFIFSDGDIARFTTTESKKLKGNVFMDKCATLNSGSEFIKDEGGYFKSESNSEFIDLLMQSGVLYQNPEYGEKNLDIILDPIDDGHIIPIGHRLKVELESKYISKEKISKNASTESSLQSSILVMPRIVYLTENAFQGSDAKPLSDYYSFLYLNSAAPFTNGNAPTVSNCQTKSDEGSVTLNQSGTNSPGTYICSFSNSSISNFYVKIDGTSKPATLSLATNKTELEYSGGEDCASITINVENRANSATTSYTVGIDDDAGSIPNGWRIEKPANGSVTIQSTQSSEQAYRVCVTTSDAESRSIKISLSADCFGNGGTCNVDAKKRDATISKSSSTNKVHRKDVAGLEDLIDCPTGSNVWNISSANANDCQKEIASSPYKETWDCYKGSEVSLISPAESAAGSCEFTGEEPTTKKAVPSGDPLIYQVSHKLKRHSLAVITPEYSSFSLTLSAAHPLDGSAITQSCDKGCTLYHGLAYTLNISNGNYDIVKFGGYEIYSPYTITLTSDNGLEIALTTQIASSSSQASSSSSEDTSSSASSSSSSPEKVDGETTIISGMTLSDGTHAIANTIYCSGACGSGGSCSATGIGGASCSSSPGYSCGCFYFSAGSTVTVSGGGLRLDYCDSNIGSFSCNQ